MTQLLLALLLSLPAAAQAPVDACRTGRILEARPLRLSILPTNGSAPVELLLRFAGCRTVEYEPLLGSPILPSAARTYRAAGIAWEIDLYTEDGEDTTELYVFYAVPGSKDLGPVGFFKPVKTAAVAAGRVDWGKQKLVNFTPPKFEFEARVVTQ